MTTDFGYGDLVNGTCSKCGRAVGAGEFPFCPHGLGHAAIARDEIPGGVVVENYGPHPMRFDSHSERRRYMKANGLVEKDRFCPTPGTDKDPQGIPNPAGYVDEKTLENARALISRNGQTYPETGNTPGVLVNFRHATLSKEEAHGIRQVMDT